MDKYINIIEKYHIVDSVDSDRLIVDAKMIIDYLTLIEENKQRILKEEIND